MKTRLVFDDAGSHKFWEISVEGKSHTVRFGRVGTEGQTKTKMFDSPAAAQKDAESLIRSKTNKGYKADSAGAAKAAPAKASKPAGQLKVGEHIVPEILQRFASWFRDQPEGSLGVEGLDFEEIYEEWDPELTPRLRRDGYVLFTLGEGSMIVPLRVGAATPVVLLDSEGESKLLAPSLEDFLIRWSKAKTGIWEIDGLEDEEPEGITASGQKAFQAWLKAEGVKPPKAVAFDFDRYLEGDARPQAASGFVLAKASPVTGLSKRLGELVDLVGRRADDPVVEAFVTKVLKQKVPQSTTDDDNLDAVEAQRLGITELMFSHAVEHDAYPPIAKTKRAYIPYVTGFIVNEAWPEALPFGLTWDASAEALTQALGAPRMVRVMLGDDEFEPWWSKVIDPARGVELHVERRKKGISVWFRLSQGSSLVDAVLMDEEKHRVGLFVAWALSRKLLDTSRFAAQRSLVTDIQTRKAQGSALVEAALGRGLRDDHFLDLPGNPDLRDRLRHYFHDEPTLDGDLEKLFGKQKGPHGHTAPKLVSDTWDAVDKAAKVLDERFAPWVRKS